MSGFWPILMVTRADPPRHSLRRQSPGSPGSAGRHSRSSCDVAGRQGDFTTEPQRARRTQSANHGESSDQAQREPTWIWGLSLETLDDGRFEQIGGAHREDARSVGRLAVPAWPAANRRDRS